MNVPLGLWCLGIAILPVMLYGLLLWRDRRMMRRERLIKARCLRLEKLFKEVAQNGEYLTRVYPQAYNGGGYPYHLFMVEYRTPTFRIETIWLPVAEFLNAEDERVKRVLSNELAQPGIYTIPDWTEALTDYILRYRHLAKPGRSARLRGFLRQ